MCMKVGTCLLRRIFEIIDVTNDFSHIKNPNLFNEQ